MCLNVAADGRDETPEEGVTRRVWTRKWENWANGRSQFLWGGQRQR